MYIAVAHCKYASEHIVAYVGIHAGFYGYGHYTYSKSAAGDQGNDCISFHFAVFTKAQDHKCGKHNYRNSDNKRNR